jgi:hypothetical protein
VFLNNLEKLIEVFADDSSVECLGTFGIKARWSSKLDLRMSFKKTSDPQFTGLLPTESLSFLLDHSFVEWMAGVGEENNPVNKNLLSVR